MTAIELKDSLINNIQGTNDVSAIEKISKYVKKVMGETKRDRITKADLVFDPRALEIVKDLKGALR